MSVLWIRRGNRAGAEVKITEHDYAEALAKIQMNTGTIAGRCQPGALPGLRGDGAAGGQRADRAVPVLRDAP